MFKFFIVYFSKFYILGWHKKKETGYLRRCSEWTAGKATEEMGVGSRRVEETFRKRMFHVKNVINR